MGDATGTALLLGAAGTYILMSAWRSTRPKHHILPMDFIYEVNGYRNTVGASENLKSGANRQIGTPKAVVTVNAAGGLQVALPDGSSNHPIRRSIMRGQLIKSHC